MDGSPENKWWFMHWETRLSNVPHKKTSNARFFKPGDLINNLDTETNVKQTSLRQGQKMYDQTI